MMIALQIMAVIAMTVAVIWTSGELVRHFRNRRIPHRWQWRASVIENRTADILWLRDRNWMIVKLAGAVTLMTCLIVRILT